MELWIGLDARIPGHFFAEYHLAVNHSRTFSIAGAQVEADPITVQMAAQRRSGLRLAGNITVWNAFYREGLSIYPFTHELVIEGAWTAGTIDGLQVVRDGGITRDYDAAAALLP